LFRVFAPLAIGGGYCIDLTLRLPGEEASLVQKLLADWEVAGLEAVWQDTYSPGKVATQTESELWAILSNRAKKGLMFPEANRALWADRILARINQERINASSELIETLRIVGNEGAKGMPVLRSILRVPLDSIAGEKQLAAAKVT
jgi:hypothetical protein